MGGGGRQKGKEGRKEGRHEWMNVGWVPNNRLIHNSKQLEDKLVSEKLWFTAEEPLSLGFTSLTFPNFKLLLHRPYGELHRRLLGFSSTRSLGGPLAPPYIYNCFRRFLICTQFHRLLRFILCIAHSRVTQPCFHFLFRGSRRRERGCGLPQQASDSGFGSFFFFFFRSFCKLLSCIYLPNHLPMCSIYV
jgi:hypothetical protein